jgi:inorganic pyrophosphatase
MGLSKPSKDYDTAFWKALDSLVRDSEVVIDRPKGSHHPRFNELVYPVDYGYLKNTTSMDGGGIDVWHGSDSSVKLDAIICIVDLKKKDSEIKIIIGCTPAEKALIMEFHNRDGHMKGLLIER